MYLAWKMRSLNYRTRFIELAGEINSEMPEYWVEKVVSALNDRGKAWQPIPRPSAWMSRRQSVSRHRGAQDRCI